jgi:SAM-dependent methyltransferase
VWAIENWRRLTGRRAPAAALDLGCGTGRNACYLASLGALVVGVDFSAAALARAASRAAASGNAPRFVLADVSAGLSFPSGRFDLVSDIFVYKHLVDPAVRAAYRREVARVLAPGGRFVLSLAGAADGYYGQCPDVAPGRRPRVVLDPESDIASVIFTFAELMAELSGVFALEMSWLREKPGLMHGREYRRRTVASIWRVTP